MGSVGSLKSAFCVIVVLIPPPLVDVDAAISPPQFRVVGQVIQLGRVEEVDAAANDVVQVEDGSRGVGATRQLSPDHVSDTPSAQRDRVGEVFRC